VRRARYIQLNKKAENSDYFCIKVPKLHASDREQVRSSVISGIGRRLGVIAKWKPILSKYTRAERRQRAGVKWRLTRTDGPLN